jgi:hypothetical protein
MEYQGENSRTEVEKISVPILPLTGPIIWDKSLAFNLDFFHLVR